MPSARRHRDCRLITLLNGPRCVNTILINMIVLCAVCHARKKNTSDPRHINRASLEQVKSKLMMLNGRFSDLERWIIETFQKKPNPT